MKAKLSQLIFSCLFLLLAILSHAKLAEPKGTEKQPPFEFLKNLQGSQKGDNLKGIHELKKYLKEFGYFNDHSKNDAHANDEFDDLLETAIKTYQLNFNLKDTGILDTQTVSKMMIPRCGVADIANGRSWMRIGKKWQHDGHNSFDTTSQYTFIRGNPKWPTPNIQLTYGFTPNTDPAVISPIARAFNKWASVSHFTFSRTSDYKNANLKIGFFSGDHGDGYPFDGPGGTLAHAYAPTDGRFHYDADEKWSIGAVSGAFDLETVALHEIGHLLGLGHSSVQDAVMYPSIAPGTTKGLHGDDIQGINDLYNT